MIDMIPGLYSSDWQCQYPRESISPEFGKISVENESVLMIASTKSHYLGKWVCDVSGIEGRKTYKLSGDYKAEGVEFEETDISIMLTWMTEKSVLITRDYIDRITCQENGWNTLSRVLEAPDNASTVRVELLLKWSVGRVYWKKPILTDAAPISHKLVKLATTYIKGCNDRIEDNLTEILEVINQAGKEKPDIICLSETVYERQSSEVYNNSSNLKLKEKSQTIPGKLTAVIAERAKYWHSYIVFCMNEKHDRRYYVTCVLIDRDGNIAGKYRKTHIPLIEGEDGITPGNDYPVFDTEFGRIGLMVCWDQWFPEIARILTLKGASVLFIPTIGNAYIQSIARAVDNGVYVVVAGQDGPKPSRIINPLGEIIGEIADQNEHVCIAEVDLEKRCYQYWLSVGPAYGECRSVLNKDRRPSSYIENKKT